MKALLLAAGRGERMRPLTDTTPKPLLEAGDKALIEHHLERLAASGLREVMVNLSWRGDAIRERLGDGSRYGVSIAYSDEGPEPLETAGAVVHARGWIGAEPFVMVNADIWTDYPFERLALPAGRLAHLVLVPNPAHNPAGDFVFAEPGRGSGPLAAKGGPGTAFTFAGIGVYSPALFAALAPGKHPLAPLLYAACECGEVSGERYDGDWFDIGTPERLAALHTKLKSSIPPPSG